MTRLIETEKLLFEVTERPGLKVLVIYDKVLARPLAPIVLSERDAKQLADALVGKEKD